MSTVVSFSKKHTIKKAILPPVIGLVVALSFITAINYQRISAEVRYVKAAQTPIVTTPAPISDVRPRIVIPKLGIEAPVVYDADTEDEALFQKLLERGVVHYPFTAKPNATGNTVIFGHSSNNWFAPGDYKSIFATLDKAEVNDTVELYYEGIRYTYLVKDQKIVKPSDISVLQPSTNAKLTLITCWPVGTAANRLIITADKL